MNSGKIRPVTPIPLIILFLIISGCSILIGALYYNNQKNNILKTSLQELTSIADLKVRQLMQWRLERIGDGTFLSQNVTLIKQFSDFLRNTNNKKLHDDLLSDIKALTENYDYKNVILVDRNMNVRLFYPNRDTVIGNYLKPRLLDIMNKGKVVLTDLHFTGKVSFVHLDLLVPIIGPEHSDTSAIGALVLRIDPDKVLFPLIQSWPVKSNTSESFIFRVENDSIVYLSDLRQQSNASFRLRKSVKEEKLAASMAVRGYLETSDAVDYNGVTVFASMKKVPESPWFLVAKTDKSEIYEGLKAQLRHVGIIIILMIMTLLFLCGSLWWQQRLRFYREKLEGELQRQALAKHYDYILKFANDLILLLDKNYMIIEANDKLLETYQYDRKELIGNNISFLLADSFKSKMAENQRALNENGFALFDALHKRKDGTEIPVEVSARKVDIEGVTYFQSIMRDITERKNSEEILLESEERFRKIFEDSPIGILITGKDMGILRANNAFCNMLGYTEAELHGTTFRSFTHPDYIPGDELALLKLVAREIPVYHTEKRYLKKDDSIIWGSITVSLVLNNSGEVQFFLAMVEDITSRKIAEEELEKSFSLEKATLESTVDGILVVDTNGKIVQYNQKFAEMWQIPDSVMKLMEDEIALRYVLDQLKYPDEFINKVKILYSDPEAITSDLLEFIDGRFFERYSQPQKIGGKSVGRVWSFRDITSRKKAEAELIAAKEKAEESDRLKTAFLHNVSHEIRTPMNAIIGFSALINEPGLSDKDRSQYTDIIFQSSNQLLSIINDIVDLASIESGQVKLNISRINLNATLKRIYDQFSYKEVSNKLTLGFKAPLSTQDAEIMTDNTKLVQILSNLINNAFKFTIKGKISFGYELKDGFIEFFVRDTGIGIPEEHLSKIFDRFYQVDNTISRQYSGAGLGLSICKAYVELMGGRIWVRSKPEEGTEFRFNIPFKKDDL
ncbi:MAG: PAS domain S-box protein [Bacteroidales bacterium]